MARASALAGKMTVKKYAQLQRKVESMNKRAKRIKEAADDKVQHLVRSSEVAVAGFGLGMARGKFGRKEIAGLPMEIVAAAAFHGMGLIGVGGEMKGHLHAFGDGALAVAASDLGEVVGKKGMAGFKEALLPSKASGDYGYGQLSGQRLTEEELAALSS